MWTRINWNGMKIATADADKRTQMHAANLSRSNIFWKTSNCLRELDLRHSRLQTRIWGQYSSFNALKKNFIKMEWNQMWYYFIFLGSVMTTADNVCVCTIWRRWLNLSAKPKAETHQNKRESIYIHALKCIINSIDTLCIHYKQKFIIINSLTPKTVLHSRQTEAECVENRDRTLFVSLWLFCEIRWHWIKETIIIITYCNTSKALTNDKRKILFFLIFRVHNK